MSVNKKEYLTYQPPIGGEREIKNMEQSEINKRNEAIALFMGGKLTKPRNSINATRWKLPQKTTWAGNPETIYSLLYNRSWEWLMPVVEKIESMNYFVEIAQNQVDIYKPFEAGKPDFQREEKTKIQSTFLAVSDFCLKVNPL